jgi:hypothetical protein
MNNHHHHHHHHDAKAKEDIVHHLFRTYLTPCMDETADAWELAAMFRQVFQGKKDGQTELFSSAASPRMTNQQVLNLIDPSGWLDDTIVYLYLQWLKKQQQLAAEAARFVDNYMCYQLLQQQKNGDDGCSALAQRMFTKHFALDEQTRSTRCCWWFTVHLQDAQHWCLVKVAPKDQQQEQQQREAVVLDSYPTLASRDREAIPQIIQAWLSAATAAAVPNKTGQQHENKQAVVQVSLVHQTFVKQTNDSDCGLWMLWHLEDGLGLMSPATRLLTIRQFRQVVFLRLFRMICRQ